MIEYTENKDVAYVDGYKFRRDKKTNYFLSSKKIGDKRKRLHVYMWEKENGEVPKGYHVHHVNENKLDNDISNLSLLIEKDHLSLHSKENMERMDEEKRVKRLTCMREKATEWHKTEDGRAWHKEHYEKMKSSMHKERNLICQQCGKPYKTIAGGNSRFCSNSCKSNWRRASGVDDEIRKCERCGKEFKVNKYAKRKYCSYKCGFATVPRGGDTSKSKEH